MKSDYLFNNEVIIKVKIQKSINISVPYGLKKVNFYVNKDIDFDELNINTINSIPELSIVKNAIKNPIDSPLLTEFVQKGDRVAIVVSDYTRNTRSAFYLPFIISELEKSGVSLADITIVIALGLHRPATKSEISKIVGEKLSKLIKIENHNPDDNLIKLGTISLNKIVACSSKIIITGAVTFHPLAGFSGGFKSLLPGVASREDILANHFLYFNGFIANQKIGPGCIRENPIFYDISRINNILNNVYGFNVVLSKNHKIVYASSGSVQESWRSCVRFVKKNFIFKIRKPYKFLIASAGGFPDDFSFYQSMKVLTNASRACIPGGNILILSECSKGWGIRPELLKLFSMPLEEIAKYLKMEFSIDGLAIYMASRIIKSFNVIFYSSLRAEEIKRTGMIPVNNHKNLQNLINNYASDTFAILPEATLILPKSCREKNNLA